jgi:hypothetical protein
MEATYPSKRFVGSPRLHSFMSQEREIRDVKSKEMEFYGVMSQEM